MPNASVNGWKEEANWTTARPPSMTFLPARLLSALPLPSGRRRTPPPQTLPLHVQLRLPDNRQKIKEVYDDDDDEDENAPGFFNISLLDEEEAENGVLPAGTVPDPARNESETLRITREQQLAGKLDAILSSSMAAREAGLSPRASRTDARLANSAEYDVKKIRRQTLKEKISEPLGLKGHLPEKELGQALRGLKNAAETLEPSLHSAASQAPLSAAPLASLQRETSDILNGLPAETAPELAKEDDEKALARLILEKSGRGAPRKKLSEIAKGLKPFKKNENTADNSKENS